MVRNSHLAAAAILILAWTGQTWAATDYRLVPGGYTDAAAGRDDVVYIAGVPDIAWYYGCGPTAAGDVLAYWQFEQGISGLGNAADWESVIASSGHINAFYGGGNRGNNANYNTYSEPDPASHAGVAAMDCLADYIGTSRNAVNNPNPTAADAANAASKTWWYLDASGNLVAGKQYSDVSWGIADYADSKGATATVSPYRFDYYSWADYVAEIDANRPVLLVVDTDADGNSDHLAVGFGYDPSSSEYLVYSEWGNYAEFYAGNSSRYETWAATAPGQSWGVRGAIEVSFVGGGGGPVPEPSSLLLLGAGLAGLGLLRGRRSG